MKQRMRSKFLLGKWNKYNQKTFLKHPDEWQWLVQKWIKSCDLFWSCWNLRNFRYVILPIINILKDVRNGIFFLRMVECFNVRSIIPTCDPCSHIFSHMLVQNFFFFIHKIFQLYLPPHNPFSFGKVWDFVFCHTVLIFGF